VWKRRPGPFWLFRLRYSPSRLSTTNDYRLQAVSNVGYSRLPSVVVDDHDPRVYVRIAADLRKRIESGELEIGQPAPSITTLCQQWGVARETAAHALTTLEADGYVRRYPGRGYYVLPRPASR